MRLTTVILIASLMQVSAMTFGQRITINQKKASLKAILKEIRKQSGYDVYYDGKIIPDQKAIDVDVTNVTIDEALRSVLTDLPFVYEINDKNITIKKKMPSFLDRVVGAFADIDVRGRVLDENGQGLPGATVKVKGSSKAAVTNSNGEFNLKSIDENAVLQISFLGYKTTEIAVNKQQNITIRLEVGTSQLEELNVVSTGYQTLSKERTAGSFAKPDMTIIDNRTGSMNILQRLDGLVPGLVVNNAPGANQNRLLVRGLATVGISDAVGVFSGTNRNPLYVVDGIPVEDVSNVNPQDVADITVLKDATAASIWGARASNGVIVIVTKKGSRSEKLKISYDAFINFQGRPDLDYQRTLNSQQFIQAATEVFDPVTYPWASVSSYTSLVSTGVAPHERIQYNLSRGLITQAQAKASLDSLAGLDNRQQIRDIWYRNASLMNHTISFSTGSSNYAVYGSGAYTNTVSNRPGEKNNAYKINLRQDLSFGKAVQLYLITDLTNNISSSKRTVQIDNFYYPYQLFRDATGVNLSIPYMGYLSDEDRIDYQNRSRINLNYNPLDEFNYGYTKNNNLLSRNVLGVNVNLIKGLKFEGTYGFVKGVGKNEIYDDTKSYMVRSELVQFTVAPLATSTPVYYLPNNGGRFNTSNTNQQNWNVRNQLTYNNTWSNDMHQLSLLMGQEAQEQRLITNGSTVRGYNDLLQSFGAVDYATLSVSGVSGPVMPNNSGRSILGNDVFGQRDQQVRFTSYYANMGYTFNRKYVANGSFRIDKSNLFGLDKSAQNKPIWSVGGKWIVSSEGFMKNLAWLNNLAARVTYGLTGNAPAPGTAASYDILSPTSSSFLPGGVGLRIATPSNAKLTWESTSTLNLGVDFAIFNNRINGAIDVYRKKTSDLLGFVPTNTFTGYPTILGNLGDLENKGIELSLNTLNIRKGDFRWNTNFNIAYNKNTVTKLNLGAPVTTGRQRIFQEYVDGFPAFAVFAYEFAGLDQLGDPQIRLADGTVTKTPNAAKANDAKFMGTYQPVWSGGISNVFSYKSFSLSANAVFNLGHVMRKDVNDFYTGRFTHGYGNFSSGNLHADFADRWKQPGDEARTNIPSYVSNGSLSMSRRDNMYYTKGDINVVSASFIKLRDITLGYRLPALLINKLKADQVTFRLQLSNVMLWKANNDGIDPEFITTTGSRSIRANQNTISFGLNVKF